MLIQRPLLHYVKQPVFFYYENSESQKTVTS